MNSIYITFRGMRIVKLMIWLNKHLVIMLAIRILVLPKNRCACMYKNLFLPVLDIEIGLTGSTVGLTGVPNMQTGLTDTPASLTGPAIPDNHVLEDSTSNYLEHDMADDVDWRRPVIEYLQDPCHKVNRKIRQLAFKFTLVDGELYRRTADDLLLKCLDSNQAKVAMGEVHEGICGTHQSFPKLKWLL
jgi:hypothetical protein